MATPQERHPEVFQPVNRESPRGKKRIVPMECLCLGFNRTGTVTMHAAMETLGIKSWHSTCLFSDKFGHTTMWEEAVENKFFGKGPKFGREEFDQLLFDCGGVSSDTPAIAFADDLIEAYPEAKVVLVERDIKSWHRSFMNAVVKNMWAPFTILVYYLDPFFVRPYGRLSYKTLDGWMGVRSKADAERKIDDKYREHYALVRKMTPSDRLLNFELSSGWEPLCEFLGKPIPDVPFPHLNEQAWLDEKVQLVLKKGLKSLASNALPYVLPVIVAAVGYMLFKR